MPKHDVTVELFGKSGSGNAFAILGTVIKALREADVPQEEISAYIAEATLGGYNSLLRVTQEWVYIE